MIEGIFYKVTVNFIFLNYYKANNLANFHERPVNKKEIYHVPPELLKNLFLYFFS